MPGSLPPHPLNACGFLDTSGPEPLPPSAHRHSFQPKSGMEANRPISGGESCWSSGVLPRGGGGGRWWLGAETRSLAALLSLVFGV